MIGGQFSTGQVPLIHDQSSVPQDFESSSGTLVLCNRYPCLISWSTSAYMLTARWVALLATFVS